MPPIHLLIKPASGNCNMRCSYCFYADISSKREVQNWGMMPTETLEIIVKKVLETATNQCTIAFQGGEPTLVGLGFFRKLIEFEEKYNINDIQVNNALQTNGYIIDDEWAEFLGKNKFLVGLSLDGTKDINDSMRFDAKGEGTYKKIMHAKQLFDKYGVEYNILTTVTAKVAKHIAKIYNFYKKNGLQYQQYIPCLDPLGEERGNYDYSLTPEMYGEFLKTLFDCWYRDISKGEFVYNRYFENLIGMLKGYMPESCGMAGSCSHQNVIEADGSVYPCDFYVLDQYKIGNLITDSFEDIERNREENGFVNVSRHVSEKCKMCKWGRLCRGGCRRDREPFVDGKPDLNYFCKSYEMFFNHSITRLLELAKRY